jgi:hypothetical protein
VYVRWRNLECCFTLGACWYGYIDIREILRMDKVTDRRGKEGTLRWTVCRDVNCGMIGVGCDGEGTDLI